MCLKVINERRTKELEEKDLVETNWTKLEACRRKKRHHRSLRRGNEMRKDLQQKRGVEHIETG